MKDIFTMWKYSKMVVLTAILAAIYAALLIPLKAIALPGGVEARIVTVLVPAMGILFGPAGAWGCAIGNLIGDFFGNMTAASMLGFVGNFFYAYFSYKVWYMMKDAAPSLKTNAPKKIINFIIGVVLSDAAVALWVGWGAGALFANAPFSLLFTIIFLADLFLPLVLGLPLLLLVAKRIEKWDFAFYNFMKAEDVRTNTKMNLVGLIIAIAGVGGAIGLGMYISLVVGTSTGLGIALPMLPFLLVSIVGCSFIGMNKEVFDKEDDE